LRNFSESPNAKSHKEELSSKRFYPKLERYFSIVRNSRIWTKLELKVIYKARFYLQTQREEKLEFYERSNQLRGQFLMLTLGFYFLYLSRRASAPSPKQHKKQTNKLPSSMVEVQLKIKAEKQYAKAQTHLTT
jgi:hypothetical protein